MPFISEQATETYHRMPRLYVARAVITMAGHVRENGLLSPDAPVLTLRRGKAVTDEGMLETPGGKLEGTPPTDTFELMLALSQTALRETQEETGLKTEGMTLIQPIIERPMTGSRAGTIHATYASIHEVRQGQLEISNEHQEYLWLELGAAVVRPDLRQDSRAVFEAFLEPSLSKISR